MAGRRLFATYSTGDIASVLGLSERRVRGFIADGFLSAARDARGAYRFTFQDLVLLRAARGLVESGVPTRRIRSALRKLKEELPQGRGLTSLRITADAGRILARDAKGAWEPESGQAHLDFQVADLARQAHPFALRAVQRARQRETELDATDWFSMALDLEASSPDEARDAYRRSLELDPSHAPAHLNLGRLLHERQDLPAAEQQYRAARRLLPRDATAAFNLGVVLEDRRRLAEAAAAYQEAIDLDAHFADAYFNLSGVLEKQGKKALAFRCLKTYRQIVRGTERR